MRRNRVAIIIIVSATIISLICSWLAIFLWGNYDSFSDKYGIMLSVLSTVISVVALIYAMITYYSIDRVQSMNSMEGNVLCNPNYSVAYPENIQQFETCKTASEFGEKIFNVIAYKKPSNCQVFAQNIQCIVDNLSWIGWVDHDALFYKRCEELMSGLLADRKRFRNINSGLNLLIEENIKLIYTVIHYQNNRIANSTALSPMENIRGKVLENPIAKLTYYIFMGLEYMKRARDLLGIENLYSYEGMLIATKAFNGRLTNDISSNYSMLLDMAELNLSRASELAKEDLVWAGYVSYSVAKLKLMRYLKDPKLIGNTNMETRYMN